MVRVTSRIFIYSLTCAVVLLLFKCKKVENNEMNHVMNIPELQILAGDSCVDSDTILLPGSIFYFRMGAISNKNSQNPLRRFFLRKTIIQYDDDLNGDTITKDSLVLDTLVPPQSTSFGPIFFKDTLLDKKGLEVFTLIAEDTHLQRDSNILKIEANKPDVLLDITKEIELIDDRLDEYAFYDLVLDSFVTFSEADKIDLGYAAQSDGDSAIINSYSGCLFSKVGIPMDNPTYSKIEKAFLGNDQTGQIIPRKGDQYVAKLRKKEYYVLLNIKEVSFDCNGICISKVKLEYRKASSIPTDTLFNKGLISP